MSVLTDFVSLPHKAIARGNQPAIEEWLQDESTKVNESRGGSANYRHFAVADGTALHWAVYYGQLKIAQLLLANGAGVLLQLLNGY